MNKAKQSGSLPEPMPAPRLPNIPISPDDPFHPDLEQSPLAAPSPDPDPGPGRRPPGSLPNQSPRPDDPDEPDVD